MIENSSTVGQTLAALLTIALILCLFIWFLRKTTKYEKPPVLDPKFDLYETRLRIFAETGRGLTPLEQFILDAKHNPEKYPDIVIQASFDDLEDAPEQEDPASQQGEVREKHAHSDG